MSSSLLDSPLRPNSPPPSPSLIAFDVEPRSLTLFDTLDTLDGASDALVPSSHPPAASEHRLVRLNPAAPSFAPGTVARRPIAFVAPIVTPRKQAAVRHVPGATVPATRGRTQSKRSDARLPTVLVDTFVPSSPSPPRRRRSPSPVSSDSSLYSTSYLSRRRRRRVSISPSSTSSSPSSRSNSPAPSPQPARTRTKPASRIPTPLSRRPFSRVSAKSVHSTHSDFVFTDPDSLSSWFEYDIRAHTPPEGALERNHAESQAASQVLVNLQDSPKPERIKSAAKRTDPKSSHQVGEPARSGRSGEELEDLFGSDDCSALGDEILLTPDEPAPVSENLLVDLSDTPAPADGQGTINRSLGSASRGGMTRISRDSKANSAAGFIGRNRPERRSASPHHIENWGMQRGHLEARRAHEDRGARDARDARSLRQRLGLESGGSTPVGGRGGGRGTMGLGIVSPYQLLLSSPSPRTTIPDHILNHEDPLQHSLMKAWKGTEPDAGTKKFVARLLEDLTERINRSLGLHAGDQRFRVDVFGSVSWGGETGQSGDLDLVILDRDLPHGYEPSLWRTPSGEKVQNGRKTPKPIRNLPGAYNIYQLKGMLDRMRFEVAHPVVSATTPIVKFKVGHRSKIIDCDININDLGGWYNSSLIFHYCLLSPHVLRPLIHALKLWAAAYDLNDPSGARGPATMSSYCLTLMAIGYLQYRGVLPNLQANVRAPASNIPDKSDSDRTIWVGWGKQQGIKAQVGFDTAPPAGWKSAAPDLTAGEALKDFFAYFSTTSKGSKFSYTGQGISVLRGGVINRAFEFRSSIERDDAIRIHMKADGIAAEEIQKSITEQRRAIAKEDVNMGKGDRGIEPESWNERELVVQDPFLWQKNCAGAMTKEGSMRFMHTIDLTHTQLSNGRVTFKQFLDNPNYTPYVPQQRKTPRPRKTGPGGGGGGNDGGKSTPGAMIKG